MPRSSKKKKKGVSPGTGVGVDDSENRRDAARSSSSGKIKGGGRASEAGRGAAGKDNNKDVKNKTKTRRKPSNNKDGEETEHAAAAAAAAAAASSGSSDEKEEEGPVGGKGMEASKSNRDAVREDVMTQVLKDFHAKPVVETEVPVKSRVWPFFRLRKILGLAHIGLHDAVLDGNIDVVKTTLVRYIGKHPAKINEHDEEGRTALALALMEEREDIADLVLSIDETDVNNPDAVTGLSPLHHAVLLDLASSAQKLAFRGANINAIDKVRMTPLMLACRLGRESMVGMLVDVFGAELDYQDKAGWSCLFYATYHDEVNVVQFLLARGVDPERKDKRGMKAIDWGEHMGFGEICALFSRFESQLS